MSAEAVDRLLTFQASGSSGTLSALLRRPDDARSLYVLAHGAGAGMRHPFMQAMATRLAEARVATFRYQFPYMEAGRRAPSPRPILLKTVRSAVAAAREAAPDLPTFAGGKSMGGRMTSLAASESPLPGVVGLVFLGFPLHAAGKLSTERGAHLMSTGLPMLFVQGTRDKLADLVLLREVLAKVQPQPSLYIVDGGDHSFKVPKGHQELESERFGRIADAIAVWCDR